MGFRMQRRIKIAPGVRLNVSKSGLGVSVGPRGVKYSVHSSGRRTMSASLPGTGMYYQETLKGGSGPAKVAGSSPARTPAVWAPKADKAVWRALKAGDPVAMERAAGDYPKAADLAGSLAGLLYLATDHKKAIGLLRPAVDSGFDPAQHRLMAKYFPSSAMQLSIATGVVAVLPVNRDALMLALAEGLQAEGAIEAAISVVEDMEPTTYAAVSLAELYIEAERYEDVVELTSGLGNEDDATALLCVFRGTAFRELGLYEASREAFKEALKSKKRDADIRHLGLSERSRTYEAEGKKALARKDLERILAEDSTLEGLRERIEALAG